jgi:hypothetical protein
VFSLTSTLFATLLQQWPGREDISNCLIYPARLVERTGACPFVFRRPRLRHAPYNRGGSDTPSPLHFLIFFSRPRQGPRRIFFIVYRTIAIVLSFPSGSLDWRTSH